MGCEEARIAKTMAFTVGDQPVLVVMAGDGRIDNAKYKSVFHTKAVMIKPDELVEKVGHHGRCMSFCHKRRCCGISGSVASPDFATKEDFYWATEEAVRKKKIDCINVKI